MSLKEGLEKRKSEVRDIFLKESAKEGGLKKPTIIDEVLAFDFSLIDSLPAEKIHTYAAALAAYMIFLNNYVNGITLGVITTKEFLEQVLGQEALKQEGGSNKERELRAKVSLPELLEIEKDLQDQKAKELFYSNKIETYKELLQILKKILDSHRSPYQHN